MINVIRTLPLPGFIASMMLFGAVAWLLVIGVCLLVYHIHNGAVLENIALRREIRILRKALGKPENNRNRR